MKYTKVDENAYKEIQLNAGILVTGFDPEDGSYDKILGATTGGITFATNPEYTDFGEDMDNVPGGTKQLKKVQSYDPTLSTTFLTVTPALAKMIAGGADIDGDDENHIVPRGELTDADFEDSITLIGDYSDVTTGEDAGYVAVTIFNALNTAGFQWTTSKDAKGQFAVEYHGHYDLSDTSKIPFEIYVKAGEAETTETIPGEITPGETTPGETTPGETTPGGTT